MKAPMRRGRRPRHEADEHGHEAGEIASTVIPAEIAEKSGIQTRPVGPGVIADEHEVQGLLTPVEGRVAQVTARFPGPIRSLRANVGDQVRAGQTLATIESNLSLSTYSVAAPISGVVVDRSASVGGLAGEGAPLFEIADLSQLWVDLHIFGADAQHIQPGVPVTVTRMSDGEAVPRSNACSGHGHGQPEHCRPRNDRQRRQQWRPERRSRRGSRSRRAGGSGGA